MRDCMTTIEIVQLLSFGYSVKEIGEMNGINRRTLEARIDRERGKVFANTVAHLVAIYLRKGLIK
jgi:DNA-binding CsgD family transcriptional regulator